MLVRLMRLVCAGLLALAGPAYAEERGPLVLAAASLQESMNAAADGWAAHHHPRPVLSFAASSALARQVQAGGSADLFVSADEDWMDTLAKAGLIVSDRVTGADRAGEQPVAVAPDAGIRAERRACRG